MTNPQNNKKQENSVKGTDIKSNLSKRKKILITVFICILIIILSLVSAFFILNKFGKDKLTNKDVEISPQETQETVIYDDGKIRYKNVLYSYNEDIAAILFMGIDRSELNDKHHIGQNGQADTIMLLTVDTKSGETRLTGIPRDTLTDIDIYSSSGEFAKTDKRQICTAYAYGDGKEKSCENVAKSVSNLFLGIPVNSYLSCDYTLINKITETLKGVNVTPNETFETGNINSKNYRYYKKGTSAFLDGNSALDYLRYRGNNADSSYLRMERQIDYLKNISGKIVAKTKSNLGYPLYLFNKYSKQTVSNLTADKITFLTSSVFSNKENITFEFKKIEGEQKIGENGFAEFIPDSTKLFELLLDLFYKQI